MSENTNDKNSTNHSLRITHVSGSALIAKFMKNTGRNALVKEFQKMQGLPEKDYYNSWDWLMPVYRKIRDIINERSKYDKHTRTSYDLLELDAQMAICEVDIEKAFISIVKFIECWNASKADR
jgi:hypothetical protein